MVQTIAGLEEAAMRCCWVKQTVTHTPNRTQLCPTEVSPPHPTPHPPTGTGRVSAPREKERGQTIKPGGPKVCLFPFLPEDSTRQPPAFKGGKQKIKGSMPPCSLPPRTELCGQAWRWPCRTASCGQRSSLGCAPQHPRLGVEHRGCEEKAPERGQQVCRQT